MKKIEQAGGIILNSSHHVLVITNQHGYKTFPKGTPEPGETLIETAYREIAEESGLTNFKLLKKLGVLERPGHTAENGLTPSVVKLIHMYFGRTVEVNLFPQASDAVSAAWVAPSQLAEVLTWEEELKFFELHKPQLGL